MKYVYCIVTAAVFAACGSNNDREKPKPASAAKQYPMAVVESGGVASSLKLPAQLAARQEVNIFPKVNAYVKTVLVDVGAAVKRGQLLMVLEAPELSQATLQARERYARARADLSIDREKHQRLVEAAQTPGAVSPLEVSASKARMEADSAIVNAEKANWQMQQTLFDYLHVTAPFDGVITERNVHPGALVSAAAKDKPMLELKEITHLRLLVDVPENSVGGLSDNDTVTFFINALQGKRMTGRISRRSMNINAQFRSERIEIDVPNARGLLSPGMYAEVQLNTKGDRDALWIPKTALVVSTERKYVLKNENGKFIKVDVTTGNQSTDRVEIFGNLKAGDRIVMKASEEIE